MRRIGWFLFTGVGAAVWLLLTPLAEQYDGWRRASRLSALEVSAALIFLLVCFAWLAYLGFRCVDDCDAERKGLSIVMSLILIAASFYFTLRGFDRLTIPFKRDAEVAVFWKVFLTGAVLTCLPFVFGAAMSLRTKRPSKTV